VPKILAFAGSIKKDSFNLKPVKIAADLININTADKDSLMSIKGIGDKRAQTIITYRKENGPFKSIKELTEIKGIGQYFVDANRGQLVIEIKK